MIQMFIKVWESGLANSLIHADYSESGSIVIEKGEDYFKFSNPGNLRVPIDIVMEGGRSDPRNAILHQMFSYLGFGERAGSGLYMISTVWKSKNWIKPQIKEELNPNRTILTLYMKKDKIYTNNYPNNYTNSYPNKLNEIQLQIIEIIKENPTITAKEISMKIGNRGLPAIKWNLKQLKNNGIIERKGTTRKGQWIIL